jgi:hypothetical protein
MINAHNVLLERLQRTDIFGDVCIDEKDSEHSNEPSTSIKGREFLDKQGDY